MTGTRSRTAHLRFALALVALAAIWLTMLLTGGGALDQLIYRALYAADRPVLRDAARVFTAFGEPGVVIGAGIACVLWLWNAGHRHLPLVVAAIVGVGRLLSVAQKYLIARPRPELEPHLVMVTTTSFPSGHTTSATIFYLTLALLISAGTRWRNAAVAGAAIFAVLIGISRVMLGVHWPSDVVGGWAFGLLWVLMTLRIAQRWIESGARR